MAADSDTGGAPGGCAAARGPGLTVLARAIFDRLATAQGDAVFGFEDATAREVKDGPRDAFFRVRPADLIACARTLRDDPDLACDFLQNLTAVDWPKAETIEVVYHLFSYRHRHEIVVKTQVPRAQPRLPSLTSLWNNADWLEREQYDLLGVVFEGHPDLRRLLLPDDWVGHPMRKDYHEAAEYRGMPTTRPSPMDLLLEYDRAHKPDQKTGEKPT
jgi:NADH-quinone oxidoreductase subunit C